VTVVPGGSGGVVWGVHKFTGHISLLRIPALFFFFSSSSDTSKSTPRTRSPDYIDRLSVHYACLSYSSFFFFFPNAGPQVHADAGGRFRRRQGGSPGRDECAGRLYGLRVQLGQVRLRLRGSARGSARGSVCGSARGRRCGRRCGSGGSCGGWRGWARVCDPRSGCRPADFQLSTAGFQLLPTLQAASCHGHCRLAGTGGHWVPMATFIINISGEEGGKGARGMSVNYFYFSFFPQKSASLVSRAPAARAWLGLDAHFQARVACRRSRRAR
jgi:hypothetical protein